MTEKVIIREAVVREWAAIEELVQAAYQEFRPIFPEEIWQAWMANIQETIRSAAGLLLVTEEGGRIRGAVKFYPDAAQSGMGHWPAPAGAIRILAVAPQARGRAHGVRLTRECIHKARELGVPTIFLFTGDFMSAARHIYEKLGFRRAPEFDRDPGPIAYRLDLVSNQ